MVQGVEVYVNADRANRDFTFVLDDNAMKIRPPRFKEAYGDPPAIFPFSDLLEIEEMNGANPQAPDQSALYP